MSAIATKTIKLGDSADLSKNFLISVPAVPDGTLSIKRENGTAVMKFDVGNNVTLLGNVEQKAQSCIRVQGANGVGSTSIYVRRYSTVLLNQGTDITYTDSPVNGASFTINRSGVYAISVEDSSNSSAQVVGLTTAGAIGSATVRAVSSADILMSGTTGGSNYTLPVSTTLYLTAGTVVKAHLLVSGAPSIYEVSKFTITRVA